MTTITTVIAVAGFLLLQLPLHDYIVDDAYIHLTFARNIAAGYGFAFNPGEPTYGITSPLWTLLLAALCLVFPPGLWLVKSLSIACGLLTIPAFRLLAGTVGLDRRSVNLATLIWAVNVWLVRWSASGMEAALAVLLLLLAFQAQFKRSYIAGLWIGLAVLCRPEIAVLGVIFALDRWQADGFRNALKLALITITTVIPWQAYALYSFDTLRPNTALVKGGIGLPVFSDFLLNLKRLVMIVGGSAGVEILLILFCLLLVIIKRLKLTEPEIRHSGLFIIWAIFPSIIYLSQGVFITSRYLLIGLPAITLLMFVIIDGLALRGYLTIWKYGRYLTASAIIAVQLFLTWDITIPHVEAFKPTIAALTRIAEKLRQETPPDAAVATGDIGVIGFYSDRYVVDLEGLITREMIPYRVGESISNLVIRGEYLNLRKVHYLIDKSQDPNRLAHNQNNRYKVLCIEPVPGGLVNTATEQWYYTLYEVKPHPEEQSTRE